MIFHIPHSSRYIPEEFRTALLLSDVALERELTRMTDAWTDELFAPHAQDTDAAVIYPVSRLLVDPERFDDDTREPMAAMGMGVIYTRTHALETLRQPPTAAERMVLLDQFYKRHHHRLRNAVAAELSRQGHALIVDCHSFPARPLPYEQDPSSERPDICIGTDPFHTPPVLRDSLHEQIEKAGLTVAENRPFAGTLVPAPYYGNDARVGSVMIEVNRGLYMDEATGSKSVRFPAIQAQIGNWLAGLRRVDSINRGSM